MTKAVNKHVPNVHVEINLMADAAPAIGNGLKAGMNEDERTALLAESVLASMESADQLVVSVNSLLCILLLQFTSY